MILALDPGTKETGWCLYDGTVRDCGVESNEGALVLIREHWGAQLAIELFVSQGKRLGNDSIQTVLWTGRFWQAARNPEVVRMIPRRKIAGHLKAEGDVAIRRVLIERWGGRDAALGTKTNPGPLARVSSHAWAALAVAVTALETKP